MKTHHSSTTAYPRRRAWEDEIQFLNDRLSGKHGEIDDEDDEAYEDALKIAKVNLADAKSNLNEG